METTIGYRIWDSSLGIKASVFGACWVRGLAKGW